MAELRTALDKFRAFAMHKINEPTRTSDGQPLDPAHLFLAFLEMFLKWKNL